MTQVREPGFDRIIALVLRVGAFAGFCTMLAGVLAGMFVHTRWPGQIEMAGVVVMLFTPAVRVLVAFILFVRERDWRYSAVSFGVLLILLLGVLFGVGEH